MHAKLLDMIASPRQMIHLSKSKHFHFNFKNRNLKTPFKHNCSLYFDDTPIPMTSAIWFIDIQVKIQVKKSTQLQIFENQNHGKDRSGSNINFPRELLS